MSLTDIQRENLLKIVVSHQANPTRLLQILREVQDEFHCVPREAMEVLAADLKVSRAHVQGVVEFYSFLSLEQQGLFHILLSDSITDQMRGSHDLLGYLSAKLGVAPGQTRGDGLVSLGLTSCTGLCDQGPAGLVNGHWLPQLDRERVDIIVDLVERELPLGNWPKTLFAVEDNIQKPGLLLEHPVGLGGALRQTVSQGFEEIYAEIYRSGLRGRGGAGFETAWKWKFCAEGPKDAFGQPKAGSMDRYVVCNADEGEPGTFKDRILLNSHAHQVFEGMTICGGIIGAKKGFLYLRGEYLHLRPKLEAVLADRRARKLLGNSILGRQGFDFDIEIHMGAGAYVCGEESALIESLEGKRGVPRIRPPYPVVSGYLGQPTVVNNVESFAAVAAIALHGGGWFAAHGTEKSKGSKIISISGDCQRPGIYEYDFGVAIAEILSDCGAENTLAIQVGGPSGAIISEKEFHRKLAFEDLATGGSFIIFDQSRDILEIARNFTHFFAHESCGFCTPCRVGTTLLKGEVDKICDGHAGALDLAGMASLARFIKSASHCGLGQSAANPVLGTLAHFPEVYKARLSAASFKPGFDLDESLETARRMSLRDDPLAHLEQEETL
jgi:[NiFe] hydrogenase diaphorase moiety large subunit